MFFHLVQNLTGNSSDLNHRIHEFLKFFTENPLVTGHNYFKLHQITHKSGSSGLFHSKSFSATLYDPVCIFVADNRNSDDMKRYSCVKYQTTVDR